MIKTSDGKGELNGEVGSVSKAHCAKGFSLEEGIIVGTISDNLVTLKKNIQQVVEKYKLTAVPELVAVSKYHGQEAVEEAILAGQRVFGENKVQEALYKWPEFKQAYPDVVLHMIGPLQTNKVKDVFKVFDVIESIDRPKLVKEIAKQQEKTGKVLQYFIQVNIGNEPQKAGVLPEDLEELLKLCKKLQVPISGLMCIPPAGQDAAPYFIQMQQLASQYQLRSLSMGMSSDYPVAIQYGASFIRVGTAIFGTR